MNLQDKLASHTEKNTRIGTHYYASYIKITTSILIALALAVILGWILGIRVLTSVVPDYPTMKFNTALGFLFLGGGIMLLSMRKKWTKHIGLFFFFLLLVLGCASISQYIFQQDLGIDQFFFKDSESIAVSHPTPGRMSQVTALCFILMSAFGLNYFRSSTLRTVAQLAFHSVTLISLIATLAYIFDIEAASKLSFFTTMAIHTALAFLAISMVASLFNPTYGLTGLFTGHRIGNIMARRLFFKMAIAIIVVAYLRILLARYNLVSVEFGITLHAISFIIIALCLILMVAKEINLIEVKKNAAEGSLSRLRTFLDATPDALFIVDEYRNIHLLNEEAVTAFGYSRDEIKNRNLDVILPPKLGFSRFLTDFSEGINDKKIDKDIYAIKKDGTKFSVEINLNTFETEDGDYLTVTIRDVTVRKKAEAEMKNLLNITIDQNSRLKNFAHIVSHNLRSHSSNMEMLLTLYLEDKPEEKDNQIFNFLKTGCDNLKETIEHLNEVVAINALTNENLEPINLKRVVSSSIENVIQLAKEKGVAIENKVKSDIDILGVSAYLDSIVLNFITNGIKYSSDKRESKVVLSAHRRKDFTVLEIKDNGLGIDLKRHGAKLFGMYKTFHRNKDSRGIGLFITKNQIEAMGGKVEVDSTPDVGSIFKIYFKNTVKQLA